MGSWEMEGTMMSATTGIGIGIAAEIGTAVADTIGEVIAAEAVGDGEEGAAEVEDGAITRRAPRSVPRSFPGLPTSLAR